MSRDDGDENEVDDDISNCNLLGTLYTDRCMRLCTKFTLHRFSENTHYLPVFRDPSAGLHDFCGRRPEVGTACEVGPSRMRGSLCVENGISEM